MHASVQPYPASPANTKPLWAAVGVLSIAVLAMGASLVYVQTRPIDGHAALAAVGATPELLRASEKVAINESLASREDLVAAPARPVPDLPKPTAPRPRPQTAPPVALPAANPPAAATMPAPALPVPPMVVATAPEPASAPTVSATQLPGFGVPSVATDSGTVVGQSAPAKTICGNCGTVESVAAVHRQGSGGGVGTVAGGAIGAVIGNQIGKSSGRAMATILGAIGGGVAGNMIEKNMKKETAYRVQVRMDDGSLRTVEQAAQPVVGSKVTVDGGAMHSATASWPTPTPAKPSAQAQPVPTYDRI